MTYTQVTYTQDQLDAAAVLMDDAIREDIHDYEQFCCDPDTFLREYMRRHAEKFGEEFCWW